MTNNTTEQEIVALFPDNTDNEISAVDMRTAMNGLFTDRQETIVKLSEFTHLPISLNIYEGTLVIVYSGEDIGLWLSKINQPQHKTDLIKIAGIS